MQVSVETTEGLGRRMKVQVPSERVEKEVESRLRSLKGQVRMDGFRPGKVPLKVLERRYGAQVRSEVLSEVVQSTYTEALQQEELQPAGTPEIEPLETEAGKDLEYQATFEVLPGVEVKGIEDIEIERPAVEIGDEDVDAVLERLRKQHATYKEVDRGAGENDRVTIDFHGTVDGEEFDGNRGEDVPVVIGAGQMPPEFEAELNGLKAGDEKTIEYTFPERFPDEKVAGKAVEFQVKTKSVEEPELPELDDAFAKEIGIEEGLEALRGRIRESLERERDQAVRARVKSQVMDGLLERNEVELPRILVDGEIQQLRQQAKQRQRQYGGGGDDEPDLPSSEFEEEARRRVTLGLLVNEVVSANDIKLDQQRVQSLLGEIAMGYERPQEVVQHYLQNRELMQGLEVQAMEGQVAEWIEERAKVTEKPMSFDELMGRSDVQGDEGNEG